VRQAYDEQAGMFLPDRYVKGECPVCHTADQYGDSCENCGSTYTPDSSSIHLDDLEDHAGVARIRHYFFKLGDFSDVLRGSGSKAAAPARPEVRANFPSGSKAGPAGLGHLARRALLRLRDSGRALASTSTCGSTRPIGYLGSFKALCDKRGLNYDDYLKADSTAELYHFIGKDISYFHNLFWPAVPARAGCRKPTGVFVHGFLTINGAKMSKSRGTFITASKYLSLLPPEPLRFYFASKLNAGRRGHRSVPRRLRRARELGHRRQAGEHREPLRGFVQRGGGKLAAQLPDRSCTRNSPRCAARSASSTTRATTPRRCAASWASPIAPTSTSIDTKPWALAKDPAKAAEVLAVCTQGINLFRVLMSYLAPVLPQMAEKGRQIPRTSRSPTGTRGHAAARSPDRSVRAARRRASIRRSSRSSSSPRARRRTEPRQARKQAKASEPRPHSRPGRTRFREHK
jgi:methionyl-tRNA synthetase